MRSSLASPRPSAFGLSLFPLQTIFCGLIGMVTLLNVTFTSAAGTGDTDGPPGENPTPVRLAAEITTASQEATALEQRIAEAVALADQLAAERRRHDELVANAERDRAAAAERVRAAAAANAVAKAAADQHRKEQDELLAKLRECEVQVANLARRISERELQIADAKKKITVVNGRLGLHPRYVECTANGLVLDPDLPNRRKEIAKAAIEGSQELKDLLRDVHRQEAAGFRAIFMVRPRSVAAYDAAVAVANELSVRCGSIAVPDDQPIAFTGPNNTK